MRRTHRRLALTSAALTMTVMGCGTVDGGGASTGEVDSSSSEACAKQVDPIVENPDFVAVDDRLSHRLAPSDTMLMPAISPEFHVPAGVPPTVAGMDLEGLLEDGAGFSAAYGTPSVLPDSESEFLGRGGLVLRSLRSATGDSIAEDLHRDDAGRGHVALVDVGEFEAAVTWADPDADGVRPHHVLWTGAGDLEYNLIGVREPEALVDAARELVCG